MKLSHALAFLTLASAMPAASPLDPLRATLRQAIANGDTPGAVFWLEKPGYAAHEAFGHSALVPVVPNKETMKVDTIFDAASLTKVIATTPSILLLHEQGRVALDAPVHRYIKEFKGAGRDAITVRHLLTHTSGLPAGIPREPAWSGYDTAIAKACQAKPEPPPSHVFRYSDVNFILLGEIVHRVSGQPLDVFAREKVFQPLGMQDTGYKPSPALLPRIAPTERDEAGKMLRGDVHDPTARRMGGVAGHAGLFTTAGDLARFCRMMLAEGQLDGQRWCQPPTIRAMTRVQTPITIAEQRGLGWDIDTRYSRPRGTRFPLGSYGHTGWTGTALWIDPSHSAFYILLTSRLHPDGKGNVRDLYESIGTHAASALGIAAPASLVDVSSTTTYPRLHTELPSVLNGIDVLRRDDFALLKGLRIGLITNHTGIDSERTATIDLLHRAKGVQLTALFSPEHGIRGTLDQDKITDSKDKATGLPVYSLYGERTAPSAKQLASLDALVFDIQDIGTRFYTYIATLKECLKAAAAADKRFILLDRINPIRGDIIEGPVLVDKQDNVACHDIPIRHGMTAGELAQMFNAESGINADLTIVRCRGWRRTLWFDATGLPWRNPSPNMRSQTAATLYPGVGLLEFAISVGRGTDTPFEVIGAPFINDRELAHEMNALGLPGIRFIPERFKPTASVFKGQDCGGVRLVITDREQLRPTQIGLALGAALHRLYGKEFDLVKYNRLIQDSDTIDAIKASKPWPDTLRRWQTESATFAKRREPFLLYP